MKIILPIDDVVTIAEGNGIREIRDLRDNYGRGHWIKKKGIALVEMPNGKEIGAEVHWYEAHGIGKVKMKIKRLL